MRYRAGRSRVATLAGHKKFVRQHSFVLHHTGQSRRRAMRHSPCSVSVGSFGLSDPPDQNSLLIRLLRVLCQLLRHRSIPFIYKQKPQKKGQFRENHQAKRPIATVLANAHARVQLSAPARIARAGREGGASRDTRGGCAPQMRFSGLTFLVADAGSKCRQFRVVAEIRFRIGFESRVLRRRKRRAPGGARALARFTVRLF